MPHNATSGRHNCAVLMFFVLSGLRQKKKKKKKNCQSLRNGDSALSASTRKSTLHTLAPTLDCWKSFLLLFTFQLNSQLLSFSPPSSTHFHTEITSLLLNLTGFPLTHPQRGKKARNACKRYSKNLHFSGLA